MPTSATPAGAGAGPARAASSPTSSYLSVPSSGTASGASSGHHHSNSTGDIGISSPVHADEAAATKLSFFGALKKKLKGNKQQAKQEAAQKVKENLKEGDRVFEEAYKNFLEMEVALQKLNTHMEKMLGAMQESMLYLQMISQDLSFFYCTKGSLFAKCGEEYKTKCTDHLKILSAGIFPSLVSRTLQPIRTQLAALPNVKELVEVRTNHKLELEVYRGKVATMRKAAGISESGPLTAAALSHLPSAVALKLVKKHQKLDALTTSYERMNRSLLASLIKFVNYKDSILNNATRSYLEVMQEYSSKNLVLHSTEIKSFLKNLQITTAAPLQTFTNANKHRKSDAMQLQSTRNPYNSFSASVAGPQHGKTRSKAPNAAGVEEEDEDDDDDVDPDDLFAAPLPRAPVDPDDPTALLFGFDQLRAEALAREQRKQARRASGLMHARAAARLKKPPTIATNFTPTTAITTANATRAAKGRVSPPPLPSNRDRSGSQTNPPAGTQPSASNTTSPYSAPPMPRGSVTHRSTYSIMLYNNPPFLAATPFAERHARYHPAAPPLPLPAVVETTSQALQQLNQPHRLSIPAAAAPLPLVTLVSRAASGEPASPSPSSPGVGSAGSSPSPPASTLDTRSHLLGATRSTIPIVDTKSVLQQHRSEHIKALSPTVLSAAGSRRTSTSSVPPPPPTNNMIMTMTLTAAATATAAQDDTASPVVSAPPSAPAPISPSPASLTLSSCSSSPPSVSALEDDDDDDEFIPPPPAIDWDEYSDYDTTDDEEEEEEDDDAFVTPNGGTESRSFSFAPPPPAHAPPGPPPSHRHHASKTLDPKQIAMIVAAKEAMSAATAAAAAAVPAAPAPPATATPTATVPSPTPAPQPAATTTTTTVAVKSPPISAPTAATPVSVPAPAPAVPATRAFSSPFAVAAAAAAAPAFPTRPVSSSQWQRPAMTGKLAALAEKFGGAVGSVRQAAQAAQMAPPPAPTTPPPPPMINAVSAPSVLAPLAAALESDSLFDASPTMPSRSPPVFASVAPMTTSPPSASSSSSLSSTPPVGGVSFAPLPAAAKTTPSGSHLVALYDYTAQREVELSFKHGDLLSVSSRDASGWWTGTVVGTQRVGVFPSNFCANT